MERIRVSYMMTVTRTAESTVRVRVWKHWWVAAWRPNKIHQGDRQLMQFEIATEGMGEDDVLRAVFSDGLVYLGGGPDV